MKTVEQLGKQVKEKLPEVHRSIEIGVNAVKKTVPVGAKIVSRNSKRAMKNFKNAVETINHDERVIAARKIVVKEARTLMKNLDYNDLVEDGVISESILFPDTRAMHCQMPFMRKINKECENIHNRGKISSDVKTWLSNIPKNMLSSGKVNSPSANDGWSIPIWRTCDGGNCQHPVPSSFHHDSDVKKTIKWDEIVSKVIPRACKRKGNNGVDENCIADFLNNVMG